MNKDAVLSYNDHSNHLSKFTTRTLTLPHATSIIYKWRTFRNFN